MRALVFDCDGVILESEDLHRRAYNAAFDEFGLKVKHTPVFWDESFYDKLQNTVGGGKPKMRWYFGQEGWPVSKMFAEPPADDDARATLIDAVQDWKSAKYRDLISSGAVQPRPGVLRLMDEARAHGMKVAVCSAATKESVVHTVRNLLGAERFEGLDCFLAGDDVALKKPDPTIYNVAAERLGVEPDECVVVEDSSIGVAAALAAGMRCIVTYTSSTKDQGFVGAERIVSELGDDPVMVTVDELLQGGVVQDDRTAFSVPEADTNYGA